MTHRRSHARRVIVLTVCAPFLTACPLPIARTEATSAPVVGSVAWADGRPAAGLEVAVSTGWNDDRCGEPALRTRTDAAGRFQLPGTEKRYRTTWFVPNLDVAAPRFRLCAGVGDTLRQAYTGYGAIGGVADPDSVSCVVWEWEGAPRVSCAGHAEHAVVTGGRWGDEAGERGAGFYRLFLTEEPARVRGYRKDRPQDRPFVYVQWVEPRPDPARADSARYLVRAAVSLPFDRGKVWAIRDVLLWRREGRWVASLEGYKHAFMNDVARAELVFELGGPGEATMVAGP